MSEHRCAGCNEPLGAAHQSWCTKRRPFGGGMVLLSDCYQVAAPIEGGRRDVEGGRG